MLRALAAIALAALLAGFVGTLFPHARNARAWDGEIVRASVADEVEAPTAAEPAEGPAPDAPIVTLQIAPSATPAAADASPTATSPALPSAADASPTATAASPTPAGASDREGVQSRVADAVDALGQMLDQLAADSKQLDAASPPHPAEVAEETRDSVLALPTDVPPPLLIPVVGIAPEALRDTFTEARASGARAHDAIDIMAAAGTPVVAVDGGRIAKLFLSERGGITVYQFDPSERWVYYYAHLQAYAPGLAEGDVVHRGDAIGIVGSTGNANPAAPHLHFAVMVLGPEKRWWEAAAINPYPLLIAPTGKLAGE